MTRRLRTPAERAADALGVAQRRVKRLADQRTRLEVEVRKVEREHKAAQARAEYLAANPDLEPEDES